MKRFFILLLSACSLAHATETAIPSTEAQQKLLKSYNLEKLETSALFLRARADTEKMSKTEARRFCGMTPEDAKNMLLALNPLRDLQIHQTVLERIAHKAKGVAHTNTSDSKWRTCTKTCTCGAYQDVLEQIGDDQKTETDRLTQEWMAGEAKKLESPVVVACAKKVKWFCQSALHKYLKKEAKQFSPEGM